MFTKLCTVEKQTQNNSHQNRDKREEQDRANSGKETKQNNLTKPETKLLI